MWKWNYEIHLIQSCIYKPDQLNSEACGSVLLDLLWHERNSKLFYHCLLTQLLPSIVTLWSLLCITIMTTSLVFFMKIERRLKMPFGLTRMVKCWKQMAKFRESFTFIDRKGIQLSVLTCPKPSAKTKKQQFLELRPDERNRRSSFYIIRFFLPCWPTKVYKPFAIL